MGLLDFVKNNLPGGGGNDNSTNDDQYADYDPNAGATSSTMPVNPADPGSFAGNTMDPNAGMGMTTGVAGTNSAQMQQSGMPANQFGGAQANPTNDIRSQQMMQMQNGLFNPGMDNTQQTVDPMMSGQPQMNNDVNSAVPQPPNPNVGMPQNGASPIPQYSATPADSRVGSQDISQMGATADFPNEQTSTENAQVGEYSDNLGVQTNVGNNMQNDMTQEYPAPQTGMENADAQVDPNMQMSADVQNASAMNTPQMDAGENMSQDLSSTMENQQIQSEESAQFNQVDSNVETIEQQDSNAPEVAGAQLASINSEPEMNNSSTTENEQSVQVADPVVATEGAETDTVTEADNQEMPLSNENEQQLESGVQDIVNVADQTENINEVDTTNSENGDGVSNNMDTSDTNQNSAATVPDFSNVDFSEFKTPAVSEEDIDSNNANGSLADEMLNQTEDAENAMTEEVAMENQDSPQGDNDGANSIPFESVPKKDLLFTKIGIIGHQAASADEASKSLLKRFTSMGVTLLFDSLSAISGQLLSETGVNPKQIQVPFVDGVGSEMKNTDELGEITTIVYSNLFDYYRHLVKESRAFVITSLDSLEAKALFMNLLFIQKVYGEGTKPILILGEAVNTFENTKDLFNSANAKVHTVANIDELMNTLGSLNESLQEGEADTMPRKVDRRVPGDERDFVLY